MPRIVIAALCLLLALAVPAAAQFALPGTGTQPEEPSAEARAELDALIGILEDDAARGRLIDTLRRAATDEEAAEEPPAATLAGRLAEYTSDIAESAIGLVDVVAITLGAIGALASGAAHADMRALLSILFNVGMVIGGTFAVFAAGRFVTRRLHRSFSEVAARGGPVRRLWSVLTAVAVDAAVVVAAWGVGYLIALNVGQTWRMGVNQTLFLNAFLMVEMAKVAGRAIFAPSWPRLRALPVDDTGAAYWYFWLSRIVSVLGYTFLFVAPLIGRYLSADAADAVRVVVVLATLLMAILIVMQNRDQVRDRLMQWTVGTDDVMRSMVVLLAGIWHVLAIAYLVTAVTLWLIAHERALPFLLTATAQSVVAVAVGIVVLALAGRLAMRGIPLPAEMHDRLPLLETRINAFVPSVLRVLRFMILGGVVIALAQIWQVVDFVGWLSSEIGQRIAGSLVSAAIILIVGALIYLAISSWVEYRLNPNVGRVPSPRERTLLSLFRNAATVALAVIIAMLTLAELGVNIGPLIAGAGVVGLAIGFGAQKLVQDVITGVFIQFENAMNEGDVVQLAGTAGVVEKLTIRSVSLRSLDGTLHLIPFSSVETVSNFMKYFSFHVADVRVAYRERIPEVKEAMLEAFERLKATEFADHVLDNLEMHGVASLEESFIVVRARIKTVAGQQWAVGRAYNECLKEVFDAHGIEIPFPHLTVYMGEGQDGLAPPPHPSPPAAGKGGEGTPERPRRTGEAGGDSPAPPRRRSRRRTAKQPTQDAPNEDDA